MGRLIPLLDPHRIQQSVSPSTFYAVGNETANAAVHQRQRCDEQQYLRRGIFSTTASMSFLPRAPTSPSSAALRCMRSGVRQREFYYPSTMPSMQAEYWVADLFNNRVEEFSATGTTNPAWLSFGWVRSGSGSGQFATLSALPSTTAGILGR